MARSRYCPNIPKDEWTVRSRQRRQELLAPAITIPEEPDIAVEAEPPRDEVTLTRTEEHAIFQLVFGGETAHAGHLPS